MMMICLMMMKTIVVSLSLLTTVVRCTNESPTVEINSPDFKGKIVGVQSLNWLGQPFSAFLGIPYVQPPTGNRRFKDPQKLKPFNGTINASIDGHDCPSIYASNASEDCLTLNIYTAHLNSSDVRPVLVFIHPGGLYLGSGSSSSLDPKYLLSKDLVLVTFNYRLGSLGFLSFGNSAVPGNAGFKDQVFALRWINEYIHNFGGNPHDVTLMGYSAGALSVGLHLVSPMSRQQQQQLFHKAIIMSGSLPPQAKLPEATQKSLALKQAKRLNCTLTTTPNTTKTERETQLWEETEIMDCLQRYNGSQIAATLRSMFDFGRDNPIYLWLPVVENSLSQHPFLTRELYESLREGDFQKTPILIGYTNGEFCTSASDILKDRDLLQRFNEDFDVLAPKIFMYDSLSRPNKRRINSALRQHYWSGKRSISVQEFDRLCDLFSDAIIRFGAHLFAELTAPHMPVYSYEFVYGAKLRDHDFPTDHPRVEHMDDLGYLFGMPFPEQERESVNTGKIVKLYVDFIYDFMKNGKISDRNARPYPHGYTLIDDRIEHKNGINFEDFQFWKKLFGL